MAAFTGEGSLFIGYRRYIYRVHKINNCTFSIHSPWQEGLVDLSKAQDMNSLCPILTTRPILGKKENQSPVVHTPRGSWGTGRWGILRL